MSETASFEGFGGILLPPLGGQAVLRSADGALWAKTWDSLTYQPTSYAASMIDYQMAYFAGAGWQVEDASLILINDGAPCGLLPLMLRTGDAASLTSNGQPIFQPVFTSSTMPGTVKKVGAWLLDLLTEAHRRLGLTVMNCECAPDMARPHGLSEWHRQQMTAGAAATVLHDVYTQISLPLAEIRGSIRKSYRPLVSQGERLWATGIADSACITDAIWDEFRNLHIAVAGRVTRSLESWQEQLKMIRASEAFLVYLRDTTGRMVGGGLFQTTRDECVYAVGAYDRALFDKPLGHVVQYRAIERAMAMGIKWHKIGYRPFLGDATRPSRKEIAIGEFKQGFSTHIFPRFLFTRDLEAAENCDE